MIVLIVVVVLALCWLILRSVRAGAVRIDIEPKPSAPAKDSANEGD
ncbi:hypothetical protein ACIP5Y_37020 [Nocardia sp. NPDC088792]